MRRAAGPLTFKEKLAASLAIAVGVVVIAAGFMSSVTGRRSLGLPAAVESTDPIRGAVQIPQQSEIFVDLAAGYTGVIVLDGVEIPTTALDQLGNGSGKQVSLPATTIYEDGNATLTFRPIKGAAVEALTPGNHSATVIFWKVTESRERSQFYSWTFSVV